jgi:hypothetical protein
MSSLAGNIQTYYGNVEKVSYSRLLSYVEIPDGFDTRK